MVNNLAHRLAHATWQRHLVFLGAALLTILCVGYHFGTFDQVIHIPFLKKYVNPALFPGDPFLELRRLHFSYFWFFFQPFLRWKILEPALFITHVLVTYLTYWALWTLSDLLFENPVTNLLVVVTYIVPHLGFAGFPLFEFSLLNRTFVLPFILWALIFFLRQRYLLAFGLLGGLYNLHVISVNFALAMVLLASVVEFRRIGWRKLGLSLGLFGLGALPVLIWKGSSSGVGLTADAEWFSIIARGTLYNLFFMFAPYMHIWVITLCGFSALGLFFVARRANPSPRYDRTVTLFIAAVLIILAAEVITAQWYPATIIVQSQIIRAGLFALVFGYLYFANAIVQRWQSGQLSGEAAGILAAALALSPTPVTPLLVWGLQKWIKPPVWRRVITAALVPAALVGSIGLALPYGIWGPGIYVYAHNSPWYRAQIWAKTNTPVGTWFITPPQIWSFYDSEWRVFSERSTVATHSELLEAAFAPEYIDYWKPRFETLAPGALAQFAGNFFENQQTVARAYYGLSDDQLLAAAHKYGAAYVVVEKPHLRPWPVAYENEGFVIYIVP